MWLYFFINYFGYIEMQPEPDKNSKPVMGVDLKILTAEHIMQIDEILASIEASGELRLVVQNGQLRYINKIQIHPSAANPEAESDN
jgi:hypothetical protein